MRRHFARRPGALISGSAVVGGALGLFGSMFTGAAPASAHPHVFVTAKTTVHVAQGTITGFEHVWTFDEFYTAMAVQDLDKNKDGKFDRGELHELAKLNIEGLKEFKYFTFATLGGQELALVDPKDGEYWAENNNGILSMHFKVMLDKPVLTDAKNFQVGIYDPSFFIAFELDEKEPVKLSSGAPASCKATVGTPKQDADAAKKLGEAFFDQLGGGNFGLSAAKVIKVTCG